MTAVELAALGAAPVALMLAIHLRRFPYALVNRRRLYRGRRHIPANYRGVRRAGGAR